MVSGDSPIGKENLSRIKKRKTKTKITDLVSVTIRDDLVVEIANNLARKIKREDFERKYAPVKAVLTFVGIGAFLAVSIAMPNLPLVLKPFLKDEKEQEAWKRFNVPYLKRTLKRLENQKFVETKTEGEFQIVRITEAGKRKILKYAIDELVIEKPRSWDGKWRLISYDIPTGIKGLRNIFRENLKAWGFYPLHESVFLHAYPCEKQIEFLRSYLGIGEYVRIFRVSAIENDSLFREFFGV